MQTWLRELQRATARSASKVQRLADTAWTHCKSIFPDCLFVLNDIYGASDLNANAYPRTLVEKR